jgi:multiple sugar transport system substrate-binding protein
MHKQAGFIPRALITLGLFLLLAVGSSQGQPTTLRFTIWSGNQAHLDMLNGFAEAFREENPDVTVQLDVIPFGDYVEKVTIQLAGGNPPDLGWLAEATAPTFIDAGVLANLAPVLRGDPDYDFTDFSETALGLWVDGEDVYGVPFSTSPFFTYFNRDMFEAAGVPTPAELAEQGEWIWETFAEVAKATTDATPTGTYGFETSDGEGFGSRVWGTITPMLRAYGADVWNSEGTECQLDSPEAAEAMQLYHNMIFVDRSVVPPGEQASFFAGQAAMTVTQISRAAQLVDATFEWGIAPLPSGPVGDAPIIGQAAIVVFQNARNRDLAMEFVKFMTRTENVETMAAYFPPARLSVLESDTFLTSNPHVSAEDMAIIADGIARGSVIPSHPNFPQIDATARPIFDSLWRPNADVQAVLTEICGAIIPLLTAR